MFNYNVKYANLTQGGRESWTIVSLEKEYSNENELITVLQRKIASQARIPVGEVVVLQVDTEI